MASLNPIRDSSDKLNINKTKSTTDCIIHEWNNTSAESELNPLTSGIMMVL